MKYLISLVLAALLLPLVGCGKSKDKMLRQLEMLEQANRADSVMRNDSLAETLVDYFDKNGTPNERMRAYYILGRTYFDLCELPRALETYYEAADCADTTDSDCDYRTLSRIHIQTGEIFHQQIQLRSQLEELHKAEYYGRKANDTLIAIESYARQADAYSLLANYDSVIIIKENASHMYQSANDSVTSAITLITTITPLLKKGDITKARDYIHIFENNSGLFDEQGNIQKGREIYYYIKGKYYLAVNQLDSAESLFRKELRVAKNLNNQIAGHKGLQEVYERRSISDSIAKYANIGYQLNDSAYSLSEMQNIQKFQASYNYNHAKLLVQDEQLKTEKYKNALLLVVISIMIFALFFANKYHALKRIALDYRLKNAKITRHFRHLAQSNPPAIPTYDDWRQVRNLVEHEIPSFSKILNTKDHPLSEMEYDVCLLSRIGIPPLEISKLKQCSPSHITNTRKRLLLKVFGKEGRSEDFIDEIGKIGNMMLR